MKTTKAAETLLALLLITSGASAVMTEYRLYNFNTAQPIDAVLGVAVNGTASLSNSSNAYGVLYLGWDSFGLYNVTFSRSGYETKTIERNLTNDSVEDVFLNVQSTSGIIRLYMNDMTLEPHVNCIYFDNGRLDACYEHNETGIVLIHTSLNYTLRPSVNRGDILQSPDAFLTYAYIWAPALVVFALILMLLAFLAALAMRIYHKGGKR